MNRFIAYLCTRSFRKNIIIAGLSLITFILILSYSLGIYTRHGEGLLVPKLEGMAVETAVQLLVSQGLQYQIDSVYVAEKVPGLVLEQDPDPNTNVKIGRTIYLTVVTRQAPNTTFPDITSRTFLEAQAILVNYGFKVGDTTYTSGVAKDMVLGAFLGGKSMNKGQPLRKGSRIDLVLGDGKGASEVDIPNLVGLNLNEARMALLGSSLVLGNVVFDSSDRDSLAAKVVRQFPMPSDTLSKVSIGTHIDVVLSK
ncbi:MAG: PASTA domain-containing protein [Pedobacter sp.]|nr:MAG: PASTA domain-containing protein [Pedobacter sp.]